MRRCLKRLLENESEHGKKCSDKHKRESDRHPVPFAINHGILRDTSRAPTLRKPEAAEASRVPPLRQGPEGAPRFVRSIGVRA